MNDEVKTPDLLEAEAGFEWAIVEVFGHRSHGGRAREEERFGNKLLRIDQMMIGADEAVTWETFYYGGAAIFSYRPATEETVRRMAIYRSPSYSPRPQIEDHSGDDQDNEYDD